jgi:Sec-independent protein translocase protein TatA
MFTVSVIVDFLGIGVPELILILILMLIVAGPKRMLAWSYQLGRWVAMLRRMWSQTAAMLQREFDEAGVDVRVPRDLPTRSDIQREVARVVDKYGAPVQEPLKDAQRDLQATIDAANQAAGKPAEKPSWARLGPTPAAAKANTPAATPNRLAALGRGGPDAPGSAPPPAPPDLGTWSAAGGSSPADEADGAGSFGTWSASR